MIGAVLAHRTRRQCRNFIFTTATSPSSGGKKQCMTRKTPKSVSDNNERHPKFRVVTFPWPLWPLCRLVSKVKRASTSPMVQTKTVLSCFFMVGRAAKMVGSLPAILSERTLSKEV